MTNDNGKYTFEDIAEMLKEYRNLKREALQLEFEVTHYIPVATGEDIIDSMTFGKPDESIIALNGKVSDKTSEIAVTYEDRVKRLNIREKQDMERELRHIQLEIQRIEYYTNLTLKHFINPISMTQRLNQIIWNSGEANTKLVCNFFK